jgi:hypothetical protein
MDNLVKCAEVVGKALIVVCTCGLFWFAWVVTP